VSPAHDVVAVFNGWAIHDVDTRCDDRDRRIGDAGGWMRRRARSMEIFFPWSRSAESSTPGE